MGSQAALTSLSKAAISIVAKCYNTHAQTAVVRCGSPGANPTSDPPHTAIDDSGFIAA